MTKKLSYRITKFWASPELRIFKSLKSTIMARRKTTQSIVKDIKRKTRRKYSAEEKISIVLQG